MTDIIDDDPHVPDAPDLDQGPTVEEAKNIAVSLTQSPLPDAVDLPTDVKDGDPSEVQP